MAAVELTPVILTRLPDWEPRLIAVANEWRLKSYVYGKTDCACFAQATIAAVTGVTLMAGIERPKGWIGAAKFMIARGWEDVEAMIVDLIGPPLASPRMSRPGDLVSFVAGEELHLAVRVGSEALTPQAGGLVLVAPKLWRRAWKIG